MDIRFIDIPKIENDTLLEDLAKDILKQNTLYQNINIHGRSGQKQDGIDVFAREVETRSWIGVQCKVRSTNKPFTRSELLDEINQAKEFNPKIEKYYLYTTLSRDIITQRIERELNNELVGSFFLFEIKYWEDIEDILRKKEFENIYYRYYHKYFRDNLTIGHSIGKLINLTLKFDNIPDTHRELIIGKIPNYNNDTGKNVDYFRGTYFIADLLNMGIEFFTKCYNSQKAMCVSSDIIDAVGNKIDAYRISEWINSIEDFDAFIYDDVHDYEFSITSKERLEYIRVNAEE